MKSPLPEKPCQYVTEQEEHHKANTQHQGTWYCLFALDQKHSSDVQRCNIGVKLENLFKKQFLLEISQKVKEIGYCLEILSVKFRWILS